MHDDDLIRRVATAELYLRTLAEDARARLVAYEDYVSTWTTALAEAREHGVDRSGLQLLAAQTVADHAAAHVNQMGAPTSSRDYRHICEALEALDELAKLAE